MKNVPEKLQADLDLHKEPPSLPFDVHERIERDASGKRFIEIRHMHYPGGQDGEPFAITNVRHELRDDQLKEAATAADHIEACRSFNDAQWIKAIRKLEEVSETQKIGPSVFTQRLKQYYQTVVARYLKWHYEYDQPVLPEYGRWLKKARSLGAEVNSAIPIATHLAEYYIKACEEFQTEYPDLTQLAEISGKSKSWWSVKLRSDKNFLATILNRAQRKRNYSKSQVKKDFWIKVVLDIEDKGVEAVNTPKFKADDLYSGAQHRTDQKAGGRPYIGLDALAEEYDALNERIDGERGNSDET